MEYSLKEINEAGEILKNEDSLNDKVNFALDVLDSWRSEHAYPLHIFQMNLKRTIVKKDSSTLISQRLKRASSIIKKLKRSYDGKNPSLRLSQIQDIAGCRAVVKNMKIAREFFEYYKKNRNSKHKLVKFNDYITNPKVDGYRSFHLVFEYNTDTNKGDFNGRKIEIQIRTRLQHCWATAVETVDFFTRQSLKLNEGKPEWAEFFRLVSSAFAIKENCSIVNGTPSDKKELYRLIKQKEKELDVITSMKRWSDAIRDMNVQWIKNTGAKFFLLELDIGKEDIFVQTFTEKQEKDATKEYAFLEKKYNGQKDYDVVLVGMDEVKNLRKAYPNYFVDTTDFIKEIEEILNLL
jgi:ppGpp synthetase/RelA/SpoT-type nucleotidyltranferase